MRFICTIREFLELTVPFSGCLEYGPQYLGVYCRFIQLPCCLKLLWEQQHCSSNCVRTGRGSGSRRGHSRK